MSTRFKESNYCQWKDGPEENVLSKEEALINCWQGNHKNCPLQIPIEVSLSNPNPNETTERGVSLPGSR
jgi:hypothetical protein